MLTPIPSSTRPQITLHVGAFDAEAFVLTRAEALRAALRRLPPKRAL